MTDKKTLSPKSIEVIHKIAKFIPEEQIYAELKNVYDEFLPTITQTAKAHNWDIPDDIMELIARAYTPTVYQFGISYACSTGIMGLPEDVTEELCQAILESLQEMPQEVLDGFIEEYGK